MQTPLPPTITKIIRITLCVLAITFFISQGVHSSYSRTYQGYGKTDLRVFYAVATTVMGQTKLTPLEIYQKDKLRPLVVTISAHQGGTQFLYPPQAAILLSPLALVPFKTLALLWLWLTVVILVTTYYLIIRFFVGKQHIYDLRYSALLVALSFSPPVTNLLSRGQIDAVVWLLIMVSLVCLYRNRQYTGGSILAVLTAIKIFPIIFLPYLVLKKQWRAAIAYAITSFVLWLSTLPFFGLNGLFLFWQYPLSPYLEGKINFIFTSISLYGTFHVIVRNNLLNSFGTKHDLIVLGGYVFPILSILALLGFGYLIWKRRKIYSRWQYLLEYTGVLIIFILFSKSVHSSYLLWLLPILLVLFAHIQRRHVLLSLFTLVTLFLTQFWNAWPALHQALLNRSHTLGVLGMAVFVVWMMHPRVLAKSWSGY